ncbi:hypothetical protein AB0O91_00385 [Kitasatospora sp. NPDC089797]|uniref:hypothetical protein n=1 Tax=Kitasatospora sp. NPDC089797 TaxID=3155298 RepID=UPI003416949B
MVRTGRKGGRLSRSALWGAGVMLTAAVGLTGYTALAGEEGQPSSAQPGTGPPSPSTASPAPVPVSTYSLPATWTEPQRWLAAPRGARTSGGRATGFPHSTDGAIGMLVASSGFDVEGSRTLVDEQLAFFTTYTAVSDQTPAREQRIRQGAAKADARARATMGLPASGPLPPGAWVRTNLVGFTLIQSQPDAVTAHLLLRTAQKAGETSPEAVSYAVGTIGVVWRDGDWKLDPAGGASPGPGSAPEIAAPGDAAFNTQGWTAIRQAS